jgi:hypothetical protein
MRHALLIATCLCAVSASPQPPQEVVVSDFDAVVAEWRSKFSAHEVIEADRDGQKTRALRLRFDLSRSPNYDWVRAMVVAGLDVRGYKYLSFRLCTDNNGARVTPMLMQLTEKTEEHPNGEIVASAEDNTIDLTFTGWQQFSVPLAAFHGLADIADCVQMVNFSLTQVGGHARPAELLIDDVMLLTEPRGAIVQERVPFPPADIAVTNEEEFFGLMDLTRPELKDVRAAVEARDWNAAKTAWARHLETRSRPRWTWSRQDKERIAAVFEQKFGGLKRYVAAADRVLQRDFDFLGVRKQLDRDIQWLQGPWEWTHVLSRFQYWQHLGYAYWATGDSKYAEDFVYMLKDWIADNAVPRILSNSRGARGNVWRTLEAGIRGDLWFDVMELFMDAPEFDAEAKYQMTRSLVEHARHLYRYTVEFRYGNWQVVECTGLAAIGIMLPEFREASSWRDRAFEYLVQHMEKDVYPDGAHHELTPGYHAWVMERFLKAARLAQENGYDVPRLLERHEKMFEFLMHISKPDRRVPPLGDAGTGMNIAAEMGLGAMLYGRSDMRYLGTADVVPEWIWLFGPEVVDRYAKLAAQRPKFTSSMLPHAQYCVMRTGWEKDDRYLLFDCAPWGGGHSHQDRLQVIAYAGRDLLIDPGIYSYDQPLSQTYFRKSEAHNVLLIDGQEQLQSDPKVIAWSSTDVADFACGEIFGNGLRHRRSVLFVKPDYWVIVDHVLGEGEHELTRLFHFPLGEVLAEGTAVRTAFAEGTNLIVQPVDDAQLEMLKGWVPTAGAEAKEAPVAAYVKRCALPAVLITVLIPFERPKEIPEVMPIAIGVEDAAGIRVSFPDDQTDELAVALEPTPMTVGGHTARALAVCVRSGPRASGIFIANGSELKSN